jgi:hypothetical protein
MKKSLKKAIIMIMAAFMMLLSVRMHTLAGSGVAGNVIKLADGRTVSDGGELTLEELKTAKFVLGGSKPMYIALVGAPYPYYIKDDPEPNWAYEAHIKPGDEYDLSSCAKWFEPDYVDFWGDLPKNTHLTVETCDDYAAKTPEYHEYVFRIQNGIASSEDQKEEPKEKPKQEPVHGTVTYEKREPEKAAAAENIDNTQKNTKISKAKSTKTSITLTWKKQKKGISGYEIQCSTDKTFAKDVKTVNVSKAKTVSKTIKKLLPGRKYYVRIRTYKQNGGAKTYSNWSKPKAVKTKLKIYVCTK